MSHRMISTIELVFRRQTIQFNSRLVIILLKNTDPIATTTTKTKIDPTKKNNFISSFVLFNLLVRTSLHLFHYICFFFLTRMT